ncbi:MAG: hypothetical protein H0W61_12150 [Bacteroidetes bacterium]|nr:hypothetical protein [Bacteroidota bacterium]
MQRLSLIIILFFFCSFVIKDKPARIVIKTKLDYFTTDNIGNIYTVKEDELIKYLPSGKFFARYSNLKFGTITSVDATNALKLVLYYRDFQQIVFLDNQLSLNSEPVSLEKMGYEQTDLVCASANNGFWIYNKQNNELIRFNEASKKIAATGNLKQVLQADLSPNYMLEHNGYLFLNSPETGLYVFDMFGAFSKIISLKDLKQFQVSDDVIYFKKDGGLCSYNYKLFEEACKKIPSAEQALKIQFNKNRIYCGFKDSVVVY